MSNDATYAAAIQSTSNSANMAYDASASKKQHERMIDFWNMQNDYNSPRQQMQRLQEAGLNPNMIYGDSISGATGRADSIGTPSKPKANFSLPDFTALNRNSAQTDLLQAQVLSETQKNHLLQAQTGAANAQGQGRALENSLLRQSFPDQLQAQKLLTDKIEQDVLGKQLDNDFKNQAIKDRVRDVYWKAQSTKASYKGRQLQNQLLKLQTEFLNLGLDRNSPWYAKIFGNIINKANQN